MTACSARNAAGHQPGSGVAAFRLDGLMVLVVCTLGRRITDRSARQRRDHAIVTLALRLRRMGPSGQSLVDSHGWLPPNEACSVSRALESLPLSRPLRNPEHAGFGELREIACDPCGDRGQLLLCVASGGLVADRQAANALSGPPQRSRCQREDGAGEGRGNQGNASPAASLRGIKLVRKECVDVGPLRRPWPWRRGSRSHPSKAATGNHRVPAQVPSGVRGWRPSAPA
jgi:hypothetical protein